MKNTDSREFATLCQQMGALLARQDEPWKLIYAMMDDVYDGYWRAQQRSASDSFDCGSDLPEDWAPAYSKTEMLIAWRMYCNTQIHIWVSTSRRMGVSWARIGEVLSITKQAAQQKYGKK